VLLSHTLPFHGKPDLIVGEKAAMVVLEEKFRAAPLPVVPFPADLLQLKAYVYLAWENAGLLADGPVDSVTGILRYCWLRSSGIQRREFTVRYAASLAEELGGALARMRREAQGSNRVPAKICARCAERGRCSLAAGEGAHADVLPNS
jgi:hypothetical protein